MAKKYIIAAGGTGAMCARSFIYMAAAGCVDQNDEFHILLVDKDKESDAVTACENLLSDYCDMRNQLIQRPDNYSFPNITLHKWNFTSNIVDEYEKQTGKPAANLETLTLNKLLNPNGDPETTQLLATMYSTDELNTDLNKGFYGHPNIGAPVFDYVRDRFLAQTVIDAKGVQHRNTFMESLHGTLKNGMAHVYLMGSLFGGTGATVIPNVVLALRTLRNPTLPTDEYGKTRLILGGAVIMPYFRLPGCPADSKEALAKVTPVDTKFADQTREALSYYHETELLSNMMNLLLVGTTNLDVTSEMFARGGKQTQHFHMVLMLAATGACRFFCNRLGGMNDTIAPLVNQALVNQIVVPQGELLLWKAAPNDPTNQGVFNTLTPWELDLAEEYKNMTAFLRFCVVVGFFMRLKFDIPARELRLLPEVKCTAATMVYNGQNLNYRTITDNQLEILYKEPVAKAGAICRGFIQFFYDVALSGYDWSKYRVLMRDDTSAVAEGGNLYFTYNQGGVDPNAAAGFGERWMDFANLGALKALLESQSLDAVVRNMTLNNIVSFEMMDREQGRPPYIEGNFPNSIATVYESRTLKALNIVKNGPFGRQRMDVYFCEIYDELHRQCTLG